EWIRNGFKVGPNFNEPTAPVASKWIDAEGLPGSTTDGTWWTVFSDPALNSLVQEAYQNNLDLQVATARVLQAKAQRNIAGGNLFPQTQTLSGNYAHVQLSKNLNVFSAPGFRGAVTLPNIINIWTTGFNATWELDFWGRIRRQIESANAEVGASIE